MPRIGTRSSPKQGTVTRAVPSVHPDARDLPATCEPRTAWHCGFAPNRPSEEQRQQEPGSQKECSGAVAFPIIPGRQSPVLAPRPFGIREGVEWFDDIAHGAEELLELSR
jgi:hypothetical protein